MSRWRAVLAILGACFLLLGTYFIRRSALPEVNVVLDGRVCRTPATILNPPAGVNVLGAAILVHGLAANRRTMEYLGADFAAHGFHTYLIDLPGHGDSKGAFTFLRAQECADATVSSLIASGRIDPKKTVLVGHSMGGAIVIRLADSNPVAATIALSPAPVMNPTRMPGNLLVFTAQYDIWILKRQARGLAAAAGGERTAPADFLEQRAFELRPVPRATHTSPLVDHAVAHQAEDWAARALFPGIPPKTLARDLDLAAPETFSRSGQTLAGSLIGLIGLLLLFPAACAALAKAFAGSRRPELPGGRPSRSLALVEAGVCGLAAVLILAVNVPLRFLHLYSGDYLASLLLLSGAMLLLLNGKHAKQRLRTTWPAILIASALGFAAILATGAWINWHLADLWLNAPRWARFLALLPVAWIFCFAEEAVLGPVEQGKRRALRFGVFLAMRFELWLVCILAYFELGSGQALLGILAVSFAAFSVLQRLAADALRGRTGSATAAAVFGAILAAWFIAAVFPLT